MLKWLIVIALAYVFYKLLNPAPKREPSVDEAWSRAAPRGQGGEIRGGELVQDPQCEVYVAKESSIQGPDGKYFCSRECLEAYRSRSH